MIADIASGPSAASESLPGRRAILREASTVYETPENWTIYRRPDLSEPAFLELCASIRQSGIKTPLEISSDDYIISGHRRRQAALLEGLEQVPCIVNGIKMADLSSAERVRWLVSRNQGCRVKSDAETYLEAAAAVDPDQAVRDAIARKAQVFTKGKNFGHRGSCHGGRDPPH